MTIRNRLKLIGMVPISLLILLSGYFLITSYLNFEKAYTLKNILSSNAHLSSFLTEVGKERGLTSMYIGSNHEDFSDSLKKQRQTTDTILKSLQNNINQSDVNYYPSLLKLFGTYNTIATISYKNILSIDKKLFEVRKLVDSNSTDFLQIFFHKYTKNINTPVLDKLLEINHFALNPDISSLISTLSQLYTAKENSGLERGLISYYISQNAPMTTKEITRWNNFKTKANSFDLKYIHDISLKEQLNQIFANKKNNTLSKKLEETSTAIQADITHGEYTERTMNWFALQTQKISLLSKAELMVSNSLWEKSETYVKKQLLMLMIAGAILLLSLILAYLGYTTTKDVTSNIQELEDVLNKAVDEMKGNEQYLASDIASIENIELDTHEGTKEAYKFLESLVETAKEDKKIALQANEAKSLFLANMSHEIRTPLNGIVGFTEILRSTELTTEQSEFLAIIDKSSENLLSIINNILDLSKIESNKIDIEHIVFDAEEEFESAVETYAVGAAEKNINLNYYMDPTISRKLKGDPTKIKEVVINLLSNAIKFTSYGGEINLVIQKTQEEDDLNPKISFSVEDNGIGMTKEQQSRIFEAFSQADVSVTRKYGGTGLGLTISSRFVELMGGNLELKSAKDQGTKFFFSLPLEEMISAEDNTAKTFSDITIAKVEEEHPSILDQYLNKYFTYFGPTVKHFDSIGTFKNLIDTNICKNYWIDIDNVTPNILDALHNIDRSKLIVMGHVTSRSKIEKLNIPQENVIYKPVTLSKLKAILRKSNTSEPLVVEENLLNHETKFDVKILVTEDNIINQKLIKRILEQYGISVDLANNGLESFEKRRANDYDLLFMDIQMPVMDGIEATHEILDYEADEELPHIPIVALTANALKGDRERFLSEGMDEYLTKPIETSELLYILNKFLADKSRVIVTENTPPPKIIVAKEIENENPTAILEVSKEEESIPFILNHHPEEKTITNKPSMEETNVLEETADRQIAKKILIAKNFLLERRILIKVIENLGYEYDSLDEMHILESKIQSDEYDIIFTDTNLIHDNISHFGDKQAIITTRKSKEEIEMLIKKQRG